MPAPYKSLTLCFDADGLACALGQPADGSPNSLTTDLYTKPESIAAQVAAFTNAGGTVTTVTATGTATGQASVGP